MRSRSRLSVGLEASSTLLTVATAPSPYLVTGRQQACAEAGRSRGSRARSGSLDG